MKLTITLPAPTRAAVTRNARLAPEIIARLRALCPREHDFMDVIAELSDEIRDLTLLKFRRTLKTMRRKRDASRNAQRGTRSTKQRAAVQRRG